MSISIFRSLRRHARRWQQTLVHRATRRFFVLLLAMPSIIVLVLAVFLPTRRTLSPSPDFSASEIQPVTLSSDATEQPFDPRLDSLRMAEAFWATRLTIAEHGNIALAVDLADSVLMLEMQGVVLREVPLLDYQLSPALTRQKKQGALPHLPGEPFILQEAAATIEKTPIRTVHAPRDTAEARLRPPPNTPVERRATHFTLRFDGLTLTINQSEPGVGPFIRSVFHTGERFRTAYRTVRTALHGQVPAHTAWIRLEVTPGDAKAIYRALPADARLALRL